MLLTIDGIGSITSDNYQSNIIILSLDIIFEIIALTMQKTTQTHPFLLI